MPPLAVDGAGTLTTPTTNVSASQTGNTITFTYTAAAGGMNNGSLTLVVPAGWTAPSTVSNNAGYTTASTGTVSVAAQTITVSSLTLAGGGTMTLTYGNKSGGGSGATATATTGAQTWQAQQKARSAGTLTNLGSSPSITVNAADGSGTLTTGTSAVSASQTGNTITFTYTAATGGINNGTVTLVVPAGWTAPSTTAGQCRLHHLERGDGVSGRPDDHDLVADAGRRRHRDDHLRLDRGRRLRRDCHLEHGRADLAGAGEVDVRRCARQPRRLPEHHRLRRRRLRHLDDGHFRRQRLADGTHHHLHLHRGHGRHLERLRHAGRPCRLDRTFDDRRERRLHDVERGLRLGRRADHHRLVAHPRGWRHGDDHVRIDGKRRPRRDCHVDDRRADLAGPGEVHLRRRARQPRLLTEHHRLRGRRLRHADERHIRCERLTDGAHDHVYVHGRSGRHQQRLGHARRPCRLERAVDDGSEPWLHDGELRHRLRRHADHHRVVADDRGRLDLHDHLRVDRKRRVRRNRYLEHRRADLAGAGQVHLRRLARQPRLLTEHHRLRSGRLGHAHHRDLCGERLTDWTHRHLHVHRSGRRDQQRLCHAGRPGRLERALDDCCERGLHDGQLRHRLRGRADDHRLVADDRRRLDVHDHVRRHGRRRLGRDGHLDAPAPRPGRRRPSPPPPARSRTSAPHRASPSTQRTARARSRQGRRMSRRARRAARSRSRTRRPRAASTTVR